MQLAVVLSAITFGVFGACMTLPGTLLPILVEQFAIRLVEAGSMLALQPIGYLLSVLVAGTLIDRFGMRAMLRAAMLTSAGGFVGFGLTSHWAAGAAMMWVTGLGFGVQEVATNTLLINLGGERRANILNLAHLFFGVGSFVGPFLAAHGVAAGVSWRVAFAVAGGLAAAVGVGWSLLPADAGMPAPDASDIPRRRARRSPLAMTLAVLLGLYVGVEMGIGGWLTKYMVTVRHVALDTAGNTLSVYWLGLAAGRFILSVLSHRFREESLILVLAGAATTALAAALLSPTLWGATAGFAATGFGFSGIFPAVIALGGRHHPHDTAQVTSMMIAGAGLGGIVVPWLMSAIADRGGLVAGMTFYLATAAIMVLLAAVLRRFLRRQGKG